MFVWLWVVFGVCHSTFSLLSRSRDFSTKQASLQVVKFSLSRGKTRGTVEELHLLLELLPESNSYFEEESDFIFFHARKILKQAVNFRILKAKTCRDYGHLKFLRLLRPLLSSFHCYFLHFLDFFNLSDFSKQVRGYH